MAKQMMKRAPRLFQLTTDQAVLSATGKQKDPRNRGDTIN